MRDFLKNIIKDESDFVELRFHENYANSMLAQKGRVDQSSTSTQTGIGVRVMVNGAWGYSSTSIIEDSAIKKAIGAARDAAKEMSECKKEKVDHLDRIELSEDEYIEDGYESLMQMPLSDKMDNTIAAENELQNKHSSIHMASVRYSEIFENKTIVSSDGAYCTRKLVRPEFKTIAYAGKNSEQQITGRGIGVTGSWECLFNHPSSVHAIEETAKEAVDLLSASHVSGGKKKVILSPSLVGLLCHEAIGHTVEADFVMAGSVAKGMIGEKVGSELVTICDSGKPPFLGGPGGYLPFDDEGVPCTETRIIEKGILKNYLHDRESAQRFGAIPRGNSRAWAYADEALIRMTNTYFMPGDKSLDEMISEIDDGLLILGAGSGQADATGEFMFGSSCAYEIKNGKKGKMFKEVTLSGVAFDVLKSVDAVSKEFCWDLGSGYCGKGQPAKVDAGGPYIRCELMVGGRIE
jgi:TldD protein